jgi:hypothetical protein
MPTPSALDIIAAGIQDIATALNHPGPNSPLNPLTTQQAAALRDIVTIFNGVLPVDDNKDTPSRLRVETEKERASTCFHSYTTNFQPYATESSSYYYHSATTYSANYICRRRSPQVTMQSYT